MLTELSPAELVEWRAARYVLPLDDGWRQAGTIAAAAHNDIERYMAGKAGKRCVDESRLREPDDFIPRLEFARPAIVVDQASIDAHQAAQEARHKKAISP